jgi:hypothetical protein
MKAVHSSKILVNFYHTTCDHIIEGHFLQKLDFQNVNIGFSFKKYNSYYGCAVTPCSLCDHQYFEETYYLHLQGREAIYYSEMLESTYQTMWCQHQKTTTYLDIFPVIPNDFPSTHVTHIFQVMMFCYRFVEVHL